jgi:diguanylate cyclase (GGDEF)-like protein
MSSPSRAAQPSAGERRTATPKRAPIELYRAGNGDGNAEPEPGPAAGPLAAVGSDLAARLRASNRTLLRRVESLETLIELVRAINTTLDPAGIASLIVDRAATWLPAPCWAVVAAETSGEISILTTRGLSGETLPAVSAIAGWVMRSGEEFVAADMRRDGRLRERMPGSVVALPLTSRGRRVGALIGIDRGSSDRTPRLTAAMLRALHVLLEPAAVALDNALQLRRAHALSVTDDLTRLYNSRYLNQVLRREAKRASRSGHPLSLLFIDLDGFKAVNDAYGHMFGSRALVEAAAAIRGSARETDVVSRFGGDEFAVVLPDTGADGAMAVGERIRERIAAHQFLLSEGLDLHLTASVGVATLPDAAASAEELMHAADAAMYQVKDRGKNGIQVAVPVRPDGGPRQTSSIGTP